MIETIEFKNKTYPKFQSLGFASQFAFPFAKHVCHGVGYDIGCKNKEWSFPGSIPIDLDFEDGFHATKLPGEKVDYIFSSHCLEHILDWVSVLDYWYDNLKDGGTLFLYLPSYQQEYWRPWNNRKHFNILTPEIIKDYMVDKGYKKVFVSGIDLNCAFMCMGEK